MKIEVKLFATLKKGRLGREVREYHTGVTVGQVLEDLDIPESEVKIVFVNNRQSPLDQVLSDGDVLGIFPPIGGG